LGPLRRHRDHLGQQISDAIMHALPESLRGRH
jgi:hypothetical protein